MKHLALSLLLLTLFSRASSAAFSDKCWAAWGRMSELFCSWCSYRPKDPARTPLGRITDTENGLFNWMEDQMFVYQGMRGSMSRKQEELMRDFLASVRGAEPTMTKEEARAYWQAFSSVPKSVREAAPDLQDGKLYSVSDADDMPYMVFQDDPKFREDLAKLNDPSATEAEQQKAIRYMNSLRLWDQFHASIVARTPAPYTPATAVNQRRLQRYRSNLAKGG